MSVRISAHDWAPGGNTPDDAVAIARLFKDAGADLIDVSSGQTTREAKPVYGRMYQTPFADRIRNEVGIATMAVGAIFEPDHVNSILMAGRADLCALARPHLADPYWTLHAAAQLGYADSAVAGAIPDRQGAARAQPRARRANGQRAAGGQRMSRRGSRSPGMHAVVTGGGRGIGFAIAHAPRGARRVADAARPRRARLYDAAQQLPAAAAAMRTPATSATPPPCATRSTRSAARGHGVAILVNNAGRARSAQVRRHRRGAVGRNAARQPDRHVPLHAGGAARAARGAGGPRS